MIRTTSILNPTLCLAKLSSRPFVFLNCTANTSPISPLRPNCNQESRHFDLDAIRKLPFTRNSIPSKDDFRSIIAKLGICQSDHIVLYDQYGLERTPAVWLLFTLFGHLNVSVLDGAGLKSFQADDHAPQSTISHTIEKDKEIQSKQPYTEAYNESGVVEFEQLLVNIRDILNPDRLQIIDCRPKEIFERGYIPGSINIPASMFLNSAQNDKQTTLKSVENIGRLIEDSGIERDRLVCAVGEDFASGAVVVLAFALLHRVCAIYDGGFEEYWKRKEAPIKRGGRY